MVSSKVLPIGIEGHGLPFCGQNARPGLPGPRLPSVQQMNIESLLDLRRKIAVVSARKPEIGFLLGVPCARFLVCPIINNTITKTCFLSHSFIIHHMSSINILESQFHNNQPYTIQLRYSQM